MVVDVVVNGQEKLDRARRFEPSHSALCSARQIMRILCLIDSIEGVQDHATRWLWTYNNPSHGLQANHCRSTDRPNMGIGGMTPIQNYEMQPEFY